MGTDIHAYAEHLLDGVWQCATGSRWNPFEQCMELTPFVEDRNYALFAVLAGVCADVRAEPPIAPIAAPRGLPSDVSAAVGRERDAWGDDGFAEGWLLLSELLAADWDAAVYGRAHTTREAFDRLSFPLTRQPRGISLAHGGTGPEIRWKTTRRDAVGEVVIGDLLRRLGGLGRVDDVRLVFWFDR
jgi:hypothetical protein